MSTPVECMNDAVVRKHILKLVEKAVHKEMKTLCSDSANSIIRCDDLQKLKKFTWQSFSSEISKFAPVLQSTNNTRTTKTNFDVIMCMCVALIMRTRNSRMNLVQKMLSLILYAGQTSKEL